MLKTFLIAAVLFVSSFAQQYHAVLYNGGGAAVYDRITAMAIAGIVNRDSSRLYLMNVYETWSFNQTDEYWRDIYKQKGNVVFDSLYSIQELVDRFRPFIKGAITYDIYRYYSNFSGQSFNYQAEQAAIIGSLCDRIPVHPQYAAQFGLQISDSVLIEDKYDGDIPVMVPGRLELAQHAWNNTALSEEERYLMLIDFGIKNLLPRCNPGKFYIRELTDFTVQQRMFQVNLAGADDLDLNQMPVKKADLLERVLVYLRQKNGGNIFHIFGWIRPEPMTQWFAQFGTSFHETLLSNISWHSSFPVLNQALVLKSKVNPDTVTVRNKYYLIFIGTEGDASNWNFGFQSGAWLSTYRGIVPAAWGWNLYLLNLCPFVAKYYYDSATPNDGFISVTSPLGYAYPDLWNDSVRQDAANQSRMLMQKFSVGEIYAYKHYAGSGTMVYRGKTISNSFNFPRFGAFQGLINSPLTFLFDPLLATQTPNTAYGGLLFNHSEDNTFYGDVSNLQTAANNILTLIRNKQKPYFLLAGYNRFRQDNFSGRSDPSSVDINMQRYQQLADLLKADATIGQDIEIVTPQYFSVLLRKKLNLPVSAGKSVPRAEGFALEQNYPNPFNPSTIIRYNLPASEAKAVTLKVYDILGREIAVLVNEIQTSGLHEAEFGGKNLPGGIYFYKLTAGNFSATKKMLLLK